MRIVGHSGKAWTAEEDERLRELAAAGESLSAIAEKLDRTESGTKARAYVSFRRFGSKRRSLSKWG